YIVSEGDGSVDRASGRAQAIGEPDAERLFRGDAARREDHVARAAEADEPRKADGPSAPGNDADARLRQAHLRAGIGAAQVARERELASAAEGEAVHRGDPRPGAPLHLAQRRVQLGRPGTDV